MNNKIRNKNKKNKVKSNLILKNNKNREKNKNNKIKNKIKKMDSRIPIKRRFLVIIIMKINKLNNQIKKIPIYEINIYIEFF